jgi:ferredoxin/flavodoxin
VNPEVYYFSGTGNSYAVARDIAEGIDAQLISIAASVRSEKVDISADVVGMVFPDYHSSVPNIINRFLTKVETFTEKYVFAVCTYGGSGPGLTIRDLKESVEERGGSLAAGFAVKMPYNYITPSLSFDKRVITMALKEVPVEDQRKMITGWNKKREEIIDFITLRKKGVSETSAEVLLTLIDHIGIKEVIGKYFWLSMAGYSEHTPLSFSESRKLMDHGFQVNESCVSCGTCEKICPVSNITLIEGTPTWHHTCEQCFACLQWCPQSAIQFGKSIESQKRYHHPTVKALDLMR